MAGQGSGKSTLVEQLVALLKHTGKAAVDVSIDDFYLRFQVPADSMCRRLGTSVHNRACIMTHMQISCVSACVRRSESARGASTALSGSQLMQCLSRSYIPQYAEQCVSDEIPAAAAPTHAGPAGPGQSQPIQRPGAGAM